MTNEKIKELAKKYWYFPAAAVLGVIVLILSKKKPLKWS